MKIKITILLLVFATTTLFAQTKISDGEEVYGTWNKLGSPYIIYGEAIVPTGKILKIKPGVEVRFKTGTDRDYRIEDKLNPYFNVGFLRVKGQLIAVGKKNNLIVFTHNEKTGYWGNVFFDNSKDNHLKYCKFEFSYYMRSVLPNDINGTAATSFVNSSGVVENCLYYNNGWTAINCKKNSNITIKNNTIIDNQYGIECNSRSVPKITNCIVWNNRTADFFVNGGSKPQLSYCLITNYDIVDGIDNKGKNIYNKNPRLDKNFKPKKNSPCIKKGKKKKNIGAF